MLHPYEGLESYRFWRTSMAGQAPGLVDPVTATKFKIGQEDKVATIGSCFAQHISRFLVSNGFNFYVAEQAPPAASEEIAASYGVFSARYGNVYTVRQALQLTQEAFGDRDPHIDAWERAGRYFDPLRPSVHPGGYLTEQEVWADRARHLEAFRQIIVESDVLIFTLGLTEAWVATASGTVLPTAPGVVAGSYDPDFFAFKNFSVVDVIDDLKAWCLMVRSVNPSVNVLLTVSPVALAATAEDRHVLTSTTYSKAALRAAAGDLSREFDYVDYFPSYEVITSPSAAGRFYADDLRQVTDDGVQHVMGIFRRHYLSEGSAQSEPSRVAPSLEGGKIDDGAGILCDDDLLF